MVGLSKYISKEYRIFLSLILVFNIAVFYASKIYFNIAPLFDDDFSRYYQNYLDVYDGISGAYSIWNKYELGLPLFYKLLSLLGERLLPQGVLFFTAISIALLLYLWFELYVLKYFKKEQRAALIAFALFVDIFLTSIGLTRQCFSSIFILYAISTKDMRLKVFFMLVASMFHLSAIPILIAFYIIQRFQKSALLVFFIFAIVFMQNSVGVNESINEIAIFLKDYLPHKIYVYFTHYISSAGWNLLGLMFFPIIQTILMLCVVFSLYVLSPRDALARNYRTLIVICFVVYMTGIIPSRSTFIITSLLFYFVVFMAFRRFFNLTLLFFFPYFLKRMYSILFPAQYSDEGGYVFFSFDYFDFAPFYYLGDLL